MHLRGVCSISTKMQENGALEHGAPAQNQNIDQERFKSVASVRDFHEALTTPREALTTPRRFHADAEPGCNEGEIESEREQERERARARESEKLHHSDSVVGFLVEERYCDPGLND